ncbi:SUN domain-containing protein 1 isoform X4 [Oryzias latipes]|uniref:SUN domain-containing protein 1 isoform X4 n=1 Tax=Oryzias latipes TaxID=8090 RepID=UPI0005CBB227|nr:SUN domain-containing protein 1 isoform X4 [Oryzias latipes]
MSRRSLPLNESLLDGALTSGLNVGRGRSWSRLQRSAPVQRHSASCSESLLLGSPRRHTRQPVHNSSLHSMVTDTSLMSSLLEESSIQDSTMINTMWGLDQDGDPTENSMSEETCSRQRTQRCSKLFCRECISQPAARPCPTAATLHPEPSAVCQDRNRGSCTGNDCKKKQLSQMLAPSSYSPSSSSWSSLAVCVLGLVYNTAVRSAHQCRGLCRRWSQLTSRLHLTQFSLTLSWVLLPLLLLLSLGWFCFASFHLLLTSVNISAWTTAVSNTQDSSLSNSFFASQSWSAGDACEEPKEAEEEQLLEGPAESPAQKLSDAERLLHVEQSLAAVWKLVEAKGQRADQLQSKVSWYHSQLQQQPPSQREVELRLKRRLDRELMQLHRKLNEERELRKQQNRLQQQKHTSRLDQLEQQLQTLAYQIQELQATLETSTRNPPSAAVSLGGSSFHDALFAKVSQLEVAVGDIFRDMAHVSKRWDGCQQLDKIQQMISKQVSKLVGEEVRALVSGNQLTYRGDAVTLPEVLLTWLSQQFVSSTHLEAALLSLELSILQNVSLQLQQFEEMVGGAAPPGGGRPVTKEDVQVMLTDALRQFSEDRTGMADYALESAGGSILSTRCSETYETRAALLSMFGVPLWYFSQSPRTVIQPDVHPGNCWAFRGSTGFLVIRLSMSILPTAFTLEHIPKALTPGGMLLSAPRHFSVYGLTAENQEHGRLLGTFTYREDGEALQTFLVTEENKEFFQIIEVQVLSNWGHPDYTCMYRFRVHGTPTKEPGLH